MFRGAVGTFFLLLHRECSELLMESFTCVVRWKCFCIPCRQFVSIQGLFNWTVR